MKKLFLVALLLGMSLAVGNAQVVDLKAAEVPTFDGVPGTNPNIGSRDVGDEIYAIDMQTVCLGHNRLLGVENTGTWWITGSPDTLGAYLYNVSHDGLTLLGQYAQGNTSWGWRDLAYDGTYLYASDSTIIEEIDPATGLPTGGTIPSPVSPARGLAYVPSTDTFWTASFTSSLYEVDRLGGSTAYANPSLSIYGAAYEPNLDLVIWWSQDGTTGGLASYMALDGTFTGESWEGDSSLGTNVAGGACAFTDPMYGDVFAGFHQATPDNVVVYDITPSPCPKYDIKCNNGDSGVMIPDDKNVTLTIDIQAVGWAGVNGDIAVLVQQVGGALWAYDGMNWNKGALSGIYYSGPLMDMSDTVLDMLLPVGNYVAYLFLDSNYNGMPDFGGKVRMDSVDFEVLTLSGWMEDFEDGVADNWVYDSNWSIVTDPEGDLALYLDCPSFDRFSAYYDFDYADFFMYSADIQQEMSSSYSSAYYGGIHFRSQDGTLDNAYECYLSGSGSWSFYVRTGGLGTSLGSGSATVFNGGAGNYNNIGASASGTGIDIYINGVLETSVTDSTYTIGKAGVNGEGSGFYDHNWFYDNVTMML
jgi:hypothetical protein